MAPSGNCPHRRLEIRFFCRRPVFDTLHDLQAYDERTRYAAQGRATQPANVRRLFTEELDPDSFSDA